MLVLVVYRCSGGRNRNFYFGFFLDGKIAKWWMPDDIVFVEALVYGSTGKVQKMELRHSLLRNTICPESPLDALLLKPSLACWSLSGGPTARFGLV